MEEGEFDFVVSTTLHPRFTADRVYAGRLIKKMAINFHLLRTFTAAARIERDFCVQSVRVREPYVAQDRPNARVQRDDNVPYRQHVQKKKIVFRIFFFSNGANDATYTRCRHVVVVERSCIIKDNFRDLLFLLCADRRIC